MRKDDETDADVESRRRARFLIRPRVPATFSGVPVAVVDLSEKGLRLEHATPMRISANGSIRLESDDNQGRVAIRGSVVWSRLSRVADSEGKFLYQSGVQLDELPDSVAGLFGRVIHLYGARDSQSIDTKRSALAARASSRAAQSAETVTAISPQSPVLRISADDAHRIRQAVETLRNDPQMAQQWIDRARYSEANRQAHETPEGSGPYPRDVIVVWEYLDRKVDLDAILRVLEKKQAT